MRKAVQARFRQQEVRVEQPALRLVLQNMTVVAAEHLRIKMLQVVPAAAAQRGRMVPARRAERIRD